MKELAKCLNLSVGPAFFCLLGNKYGYPIDENFLLFFLLFRSSFFYHCRYRPFPAKISHDILNTMWPRICESELASADPALAEKLEKTKVEHVLDVLTDEEKMHIYNLSDILYIPQWFWLVCFFLCSLFLSLFSSHYFFFILFVGTSLIISSEPQRKPSCF